MSDINTERSGSILRVELNRPTKKNALAPVATPPGKLTFDSRLANRAVSAAQGGYSRDRSRCGADRSCDLDQYNAGPWTREGRVRVQGASVAPEISGKITELAEALVDLWQRLGLPLLSGALAGRVLPS